MKIPSIAIVGRANVGKSTLFNALCGERIAIVDPTPGVTRDRISHDVTMEGRVLELVDTGGVGMESAAEIADDVDLQIQIAIVQSDLVLFVVDARDGCQPLDHQIAQRLRDAGKRALVVVNKAEGRQPAAVCADFFELGFGEPLAISASNGLGLPALRKRMLEDLPPAEEVGPRPEPVKVAFVGRRSVGKSTLINYLAGEPRVIVSELPGTTRDSVDVRLQVGSLDILAIDTAGVRKKRQISESVDFYSQVRTENAIERADVVVHMMDALNFVSRLDKRLADQIASNCKPCVLAVNKLDLVTGRASEEEFRKYVQANVAGFSYAPAVCIIAKTGHNVLRVLEVVQELFEQSKARVRTRDLNKAVSALVTRKRPASQSKHPGNILYATQLDVRPPTIALFANDSAIISPEYERYLANGLRQHMPFSNIPIRFVVRRRERTSRGRT